MRVPFLSQIVPYPPHGVLQWGYHIDQASQLEQEDYDSIEIRIVPGPGYGEADTQHLLREFRKRLGEGVRVRVTLVPELERSASGKFKWVISKVSGSVQVP